jgi:hypothetical protein
MERLMDRVTQHLQSSLANETDDSLDRGMHFPVGWDPPAASHGGWSCLRGRPACSA